MLVSQILKRKGDTVFTTEPSETISTVANLLNTRGVGALVDRVATAAGHIEVVRLAQGVFVANIYTSDGALVYSMAFPH